MSVWRSQGKVSRALWMATRRDDPKRNRSPAPRGPLTRRVGLLLENEARSEIIELLRQRPGMNRNQLAKKLGIHASAVGYHIRRLAAIDLVETRPATQGREQLCFATGDAHLWDDEGTRVLYGRGLPRKVAIYLVEHPGADVHEIARGLCESEHTVRRHLRTLQECELVARTQVRKRVHYHPESRLEQWVELVRKDYGGFCDGDSGKC